MRMFARKRCTHSETRYRGGELSNALAPPPTAERVESDVMINACFCQVSTLRKYIPVSLSIPTPFSPLSLSLSLSLSFSHSPFLTLLSPSLFPHPSLTRSLPLSFSLSAYLSGSPWCCFEDNDDDNGCNYTDGNDDDDERL